jgi:hypothetical protein
MPRRNMAKSVAQVLDYRMDRRLWDEVQAIADRKYVWRAIVCPST